MTRPKVETVNAVTMEHGRDFAQGWFDGSIEDACGKADIMTWPEWDRDQQASFRDLEDDICERVFEALREQIAETFVRVANAAIDAERQRTEKPLIPPRVETVETVTREQGLVFAENVYLQTIDSEVFSEAFSKTHVMTFPSDDDAAQEHFHQLTNEISGRLHDETKELIAEVFVRVVGDVISRERQR